LGLSGTGYKSELVTRLSESQSRDLRIIEMKFKILKRELELLKIRSAMTNSARCTNPAPDVQIELWDKKEEIESDKEELRSLPKRDRDGESGESEQRKGSCFSCDLPNHVSENCPTRTQRPKCFRCGGRECFASGRIGRPKAASIVDVVQGTREKCIGEMSIGDQRMETLIDTGSDIYLMRAEQYIKVGVPKLEKKIQFRGVGLGDNVTLDIVQITINAIEVINVSKSVPEDKEVREMCQLDLNSDKINNVDITKC